MIYELKNEFIRINWNGSGDLQETVREIHYPRDLDPDHSPRIHIGGTGLSPG